MTRYAKAGSLFLIFATSLACYLGTFHYPFQFDEEPFFVREDPAKYLKDIKTIWEFNPARFVSFLTFGVNYWTGGVDTFGYHIVNFSIHVLNGAIVFWLAGMLSAKTAGNSRDAPGAEPWGFYPLFTALVFVAHPVQTQAVTYLWQRATSLSALFYLLALALYAKSRLIVIARSDSDEAISNPVVGATRWVALIGRFTESPLPSSAALLTLSALSGLSAMFTKQIAVTLPVALVLMEFSFFSGSLSDLRKRSPKLAIFLPLLLVVPLLSAFGMSRENSDIGSRAANMLTHREYLLTQFNVIVTYIRLMFYPADMNLDYDYPVSRTFSDSVLSFIALAGLLGGAVALRGKNRLVSFGVLFFFLALSVESSIFPLEDIIFEHRVYLPSVGLIMAVGAALFTGAQRLNRRIGAGKIIAATVIFAAFLITGLTVATRARNQVWRDKETLWLDVVKKSPNKLRGYLHLGMYYAENGKPGEAEAWYRNALKVNPSSEFAHYNLGKLYEKKGDLDSAMSEYVLAQKNAPQLALAPLKIGDVYMKKGDPRSARDCYARALSLSPALAEARAGLKKAEEAIESGAQGGDGDIERRSPMAAQ